MGETIIFTFSEYWWFYAAFIAFALGMLALDLGVFHRKSHIVGFREAATWSVVWVVLALAFGYGLYLHGLASFPRNERLLAIPGFDPRGAARQMALEYLTGYVIEKSLSVDNIFVFVVVFGYFAIPPLYQHRVLFYGIIGALAFRALFIALGSVLMRYGLVVLVFGGFLILTGLKMMFVPEKGLRPERNPVLRLFRRIVPVTDVHHGEKFFVRLGGRTHATPLLVALLVVELTDIIFAVDSVPAIFAITREPFLVFTSNIFAIMGLRALYFLLAGAVDRFHLLRYGLAVVLVFVGLKMVWLNDLYGGKFPIRYSLGFICVTIAASVALSLLIPASKPTTAGTEVRP